MSLVIWAVTGSPYSLLFAALGPVVAVGGLVDGRRQRRRTARREQRVAVEALDRTLARIESLHRAERERRRSLAPAPSYQAAASAFDRVVDPTTGQSMVLFVGHGDLPPIVAISEDHVEHDAVPVVRSAVARVRDAAAVFSDAPLLVEARAGIGVLGPPSWARAVARSLAFQAAARSSPRDATVQAPAEEEWALALPHRVTFAAESAYRIDAGAGASTPLVIAWAESRAALPSAVDVFIDLDQLVRPDSVPPAAGLAAVEGGEPRRVRFAALGHARAEQLARALAQGAAERGIVATTRVLPNRVALAELLDRPQELPDEDSSEAGSLRAPVGRGPDGVVELDLVRDGPHAVVAGTTGTGKSEFLVSWVVAMASRHPPSALTFLLIDFKGGAAFAPLSRVPHVVGIVSDLDARRSRRAIESLRAELRRREAMLAQRGARSIEDIHGELPRLVIVVDEFAAVVSGQPELHEVFADLAARGRSLGLHLVLCTQRPAGVIRDGVLANVTLRISLRVIERSESVAMLGSEAASRLPSLPRGRAVIADGTGPVREVQLAIADRADSERVRPGSPPGEPVWCEPLPPLIPLATLEQEVAEKHESLGGADGEHGRTGLVLGRLDLPADQRQPLARYDRRRDGHVLVLGAAGSGKTNALALFARAGGSVLLPPDPAEAWTVVEGLLSASLPDDVVTRGDGGTTPPPLVAIDDLDQLIDRFDPELRHDFVERLERLARASATLTLLVSAQRLTPPVQRLAGLFGSRVLLRQSTRDEHVLAGGEGAAYDPRQTPGSGTWQGCVVQLALADLPLPRAELPSLPEVAVDNVPLALVAARPRDVLAALRRRGLPVIELGVESSPTESELRASGGRAPLVVVADPDTWQAEWSLLGLARREWRIAVIGCTSSELRAIARTRDVPPPLGRRAGECWLVESGDVRRAILEL
jgi:S-DNA-T family DNA segregation ATPase FtsK/SpoIIIE